MKFVACAVYLGMTGLWANHAQALELVGLVEPHMVVKIGSPALGIIEAVTVERGDRVEKGQQVARLKSRVEVVEADLAKAKHGYLSSQYERMSHLGSEAFASKQVVDQAQTEMRVAKLEMDRQAILLQNRRIDSPVTGVVVKKLLSPGEYVYEQTPIIVVAQIDPLDVEVRVPISHFKKLSKGMNAWVSLDVGPDAKPHLAKVTVIDKVMDPASGTFGVRLELPNRKLDIPAGQKCKVTFRDL